MGWPRAEFTAVPDLDTFAVLPWDTSVARVFCRLYEPDHLPEVGGRPLDTDARGHFRRMHAEFTEATGLHLRSGCEPEMTWTGPGLAADVRPGGSPAYHVDHLERYRPIYQKVITYAQALGLDMIEGDYEDPGQLELNWMFDHADLTADRLVTYRQICRQVARELGITASFMPKPASGMMGNGCHHNVSLWRGEENILADPGRRELHLTEVGHHVVGGLLAHAGGSMAIMASTVNSYKRYWDAGQFAPSQANWGMDNKTCTVRLSGQRPAGVQAARRQCEPVPVACSPSCCDAGRARAAHRPRSLPGRQQLRHRIGASAHRLGPDLSANEEPQIVVPAGCWQTATTLGAFTLVGCTVSPGFRFESLEMAPKDWRPTPRRSAAG